MRDQGVQIRPRHDDYGVSVALPNDYVELTMAEAERLIITLRRSIRASKKYKYDCPKPLMVSGHDAVFAKCEAYKKGYSWSGEMGGWEMKRENIREVLDWCKSVLHYLDKHGGSEKK